MKTLAEQLAKVVTTLRKEKIRFAMAGGLAASLYREQERMTKDLDLLFVADANTEQKATHLIATFGLRPMTLRIAELRGGPMHQIKRQNSEVAMICGVPKEGSGDIQVDFLLPPVPWFEIALNRSEKNLIDFGCGKIPCLMVEDVILSKLYALDNRSTRFKDLDDLQSIFRANTPLDLVYLVDRMKSLKLAIPSALDTEAPAVLRKLRR